MAKWVGLAMPEPNRPPWLIAEDLRAWSIWQLVEMGVTLVMMSGRSDQAVPMVSNMQAEMASSGDLPPFSRKSNAG